MMLDWNDYQKQIGAQLAHFMKLTPDSVRGYQTLSSANAKDSHLGEKIRQLISLAVAVTTRCDGCITVHTDAALKLAPPARKSPKPWCRHGHERRCRPHLFAPRHGRRRRPLHSQIGRAAWRPNERGTTTHMLLGCFLIV